MLSKALVPILIALLSPAIIAEEAKFPMPSRLEIPLLRGDEGRGGLGGPVPSLYPIGWSRDGKLAFILTNAWSDGGGCQTFTLGIYDLVKDGYVWSRDSTVFGDEFPGNARRVWQKSQGAFVPRLREFRIIPQAFACRTLPRGIGQDTLHLETSLTRIEPEDTEWMLPFVKQATIRLRSVRNGWKVVYRRAPRDSGHIGLLGVTVHGVLESPYERRIALILSETYMGWEGPPSLATLRIIGCDLTQGFRRSN